MRYLLGMLAYLVPTFPLGYFWHLHLFKGYYDALEVYRAELIIPLGLSAMLIQGLVWAFLYDRLFAGEHRGRGAVKFGLLAALMAWSFLVLPIAAKHRSSSRAAESDRQTGSAALKLSRPTSCRPRLWCTRPTPTRRWAIRSCWPGAGGPSVGSTSARPFT